MFLNSQIFDGCVFHKCVKKCGGDLVMAFETFHGGEIRGTK